MSESTTKNSQLAELGINSAEQILEISVQDDYADKIAAEYIEKMAGAEKDKNSLIYKSIVIKEGYRESEIHKSINHIINQLEPLRVIIIREKLALNQAVAQGNTQIANEIIKMVAKKKLEKSNLKQKLNTLMSSVNKLELAS